MSITLEELQKQVHNLAVEKGWWPLYKDNPKAPPEFNRYSKALDREAVNIPEKLALMHSEISEALEHYRAEPSDGINAFEDGAVIYKMDNPEKPDGFWIELADCMIRILDLAGAYNVNMEGLIKQKHEYNKTRPYRHGNKKC